MMTETSSTSTSDPSRRIGIVIVGHVDAGKSTASGRLIYDLGGIDDRTKEKLETLAKENGKEGFGFAYFMDTGKEERIRGITINCQSHQFRTTKYDYTLTDAPGHADFIKNMITGAGQADVAILMVPADGNFEASIAKPSNSNPAGGQTRQHSELINLLGIKQIVVCVNKMDATVGCKYSEKRFNEIKEEVSRMLLQSGYHPETVPFIPISGFNGENLLNKSTNMSWYKGWTGIVDYTVKPKKKGKYDIIGGVEIKGVTLVDALDNYMKRPIRDEKGPLRISVSDAKLLTGHGLVTMGRIESGIVNKDDVLCLASNGLSGKVFSIEMHHSQVDTGVAGFNVGMVIKFPKGTKPKQVKRGDLLFRPSDFADNPESTPRAVKSFRAIVKVQNHPGELKKGFSPQMCVRTGRSPCKISEILWIKGKRTGGKQMTDEKIVSFVKKNEMAEIIFEPQGFLYLEPFERSEVYGRVAGMEGKTLVVMGKVTDVEFKEMKDPNAK